MTASATETFREWHDFYLLVGGAAATLIGAMFVVASIGSSFLTPRSIPQIRAFLTPTVIHLFSVVLAAALALVPALEWRVAGTAFGILGVAGIGYAVVVGWRVVHQNQVDWGDRLWYALIPLVGYAVILAAGLSALLDALPSVPALALGPLLLLGAGVRNAWDLIVFFASREQGPE